MYKHEDKQKRMITSQCLSWKRKIRELHSLFGLDLSKTWQKDWSISSETAQCLTRRLQFFWPYTQHQKHENYDVSGWSWSDIKHRLSRWPTLMSTHWNDKMTLDILMSNSLLSISSPVSVYFLSLSHIRVSCWSSFSLFWHGSSFQHTSFSISRNFSQGHPSPLFSSLYSF